MKTIIFLFIALFYSHSPSKAATWNDQLVAELRALDERTPGELGVYIKRLSDGSTLDYEASREWYLASTIKVPVAIALLQEVEAGKISLKQSLTLQQSDFVDGSGEVIWRKPGEQLEVGYLLEKMLTQSDSTATDMLIRLIGESQLNSIIKEKIAPDGFEPFTTLVQVRKDAYGELHEKGRNLTNMDFIELKKAGGPAARLTAFAKKIGVDKKDLKFKTLNEAFEKYYERKLNSSNLNSFGGLLERLARGELLNSENTALVFSHMEKMTTGDARLKAGFPKGTKFAQKTGTQIARICNVGIARSPSKNSYAQGVVITACVEKFSDQAAAEKVLKAAGQAIAKARVL